jgi:BatD DUF11 like domain
MSSKYTQPRKIKTGMKTFLQTLLVFITITGGIAQAANITVTTSRNPVALDDSFHLIYEADSSVDDDPDFSPVYQYFDVLSSSQSTNMRSVNGSWSLKKTWDLSVIAKNVGKFTVPAISFGKDISPAIQITVSNSSSPNSVSPNGQATIPAKIFLESSIDKKSSWVQSQLLYTVRLFRTVSIAGASITEPVTSDPDAIIHQISEDKYQTTRSGIRYEVFERRYAIFPQKSGRLKIKPVTFEGRVNSTQPRTIFDQFRISGQLKRLRSRSVEVDVKAAPADINLQDWLPASKFQLVEEWSDDINDIKAGEPITRTITIAAEGLTAVQLPDLSIDDIDGLKQYPDKAITEDRKDNAGITGLKQIKIALIPARAGNYTLPEIKLEWWNTKTNKKEVATLPAVMLSVTGTVIENNYPVAPPADQNPQPQNTLTPTGNELTPLPTIAYENEPYWKWLTLFFAIAWLVTLVLLFRKPDADKPLQKNTTKNSIASIKAATAKVEKYATQGNAHETRVALIEWAKTFYGDETITNLSQITELCSPQLGQTIKRLNQALYSSDMPAWQGNDLLATFKNEQKTSHTKPDTHTSALKPLYNR